MSVFKGKNDIFKDLFRTPYLFYFVTSVYDHLYFLQLHAHLKQSNNFSF